MYRIKIATRAKLHSQIQTRFFDLRLCTAVDLERYTGKTICAIASVSSTSITVKSPKRLHTYARAKNSTEQRNEQRVYRTSEIVRARNFSLPRVRPRADHFFFQPLPSLLRLFYTSLSITLFRLSRSKIAFTAKCAEKSSVLKLIGTKIKMFVLFIIEEVRLYRVLRDVNFL